MGPALVVPVWFLEDTVSVFTSKITDTIPVPTDPGETVTIRKLAPRHLEKASRASMQESIDLVKSVGGASLIKEIQSLGAGDVDAAAAKAKAANPLAGYHRETLLVSGIVAWSYPEPVSAELIADLDEETQEALGQAILRLAKPSLFQTADEVEADTVKG